MKKDTFSNSIAYEAAREGVTNEIAYHRAAMREAKTEDERERHREAIRNLHEVRDRLDPDNPEMIEVVRLFLRSINSTKRKHPK